MRKNMRPLLLLLAAAAVLLLIYQGGRWLEKRGRKPEPRGDHEQRYEYDPTVEVDGALYRRRRNLTSILLLGVDKTSGETARSDYRSGGQADFLRLLVIDPAQKRVYQLQIDRDTMTPIAILGVLGNRSGTRTAQISLSHGFGDGGAQSCALTREAVENLLGGVTVDFYMALDMDGIAALNDLAGGVTVTLEEDFSALDPAMTKGATLTLSGKQAEYFVRGRRSVGDGDNASRMARQETYLAQLLQKIDAGLRGDESFAGRMYDALEPYLTTDMARGRLINEVWAAREYERVPVLSLAGEHHVAADGFMQFEADEASVARTAATLFYEKVQ